jgi:hypothetical protein
VLRRSSGARRGSGREIRPDGKLTRLPRTAFFILSPALPRLRDDTLRGALRRLVARPRRLHRCRRGLGGGGHRLPEQVDRRAASAQDPDRRRVRLPRPVRTVSGLRHRRLGRVPRETGPPSIAKVRTTIKNKTGTYLLLVSTGHVPVIPMRRSAALIVRTAIHVTGSATAILEATGRHRPDRAALTSLHQARRSPSLFGSSSSSSWSGET